MDLTCLCLQINNTVVFSNQTHIKLIKKFKGETMATVNPKYTKSTLSLWSNTILRVSHYRIKDVNLRTKRLGQLEREKEREKEREREKNRES